jgi:hypothetical protein
LHRSVLDRALTPEVKLSGGAKLSVDVNAEFEKGGRPGLSQPASPESRKTLRRRNSSNPASPAICKTLCARQPTDHGRSQIWGLRKIKCDLLTIASRVLRISDVVLVMRIGGGILLLISKHAVEAVSWLILKRASAIRSSGEWSERARPPCQSAVSRKLRQVP